jgi:hypothetical protein
LLLLLQLLLFLLWLFLLLRSIVIEDVSWWTTTTSRTIVVLIRPDRAKVVVVARDFVNLLLLWPNNNVDDCRQQRCASSRWRPYRSSSRSKHAVGVRRREDEAFVQELALPHGLKVRREAPGFRRRQHTGGQRGHSSSRVITFAVV